VLIFVTRQMTMSPMHSQANFWQDGQTALVIGMIGDGFLMLFFVGALAGLFQSPPNKEPFEELARTGFRLGVTATMFFYLRRADVRDAFRGRPSPPRDADGAVDNVDSAIQTGR
jgi:hypothetical protein